MIKDMKHITAMTASVCLSLGLLGPVSLCCGQCPGDVIRSGTVNGTDLAEILASWGACSDCLADLNQDFQVDGLDLAIALGAWGPCPPVIVDVQPAESSLVGGVDVLIRGEFLGGATSVHFGNEAAIGWQVVSSTEILAIPPASAPGAVDVRVNAGGREGVLPGVFLYGAPTIENVTPTYISASGGVVTVSGRFFAPQTRVMFGSVPAKSIRMGSDGALEVVVPALPPGNTDVSVELAGYSDTLRSAIEVVPASLTAIEPDRGIWTGGTSVVLRGANLEGVSSVLFDGVPALSVQQISPNEIRAVTPAGQLGAVVEVRFAGAAGTAVIPGGYRFISVDVPVWAELIEELPSANVVWNLSHRDAITATRLAWRVRDRATQIEMVLVPPGSFQMGCTNSYFFGCPDGNGLPGHPVQLTAAFYLGRYEVTQEQWIARAGWNPSRFQASQGYPGSNQRPVERVMWYWARDFLEAAGLRLPSEAEWEYAYRAGTSTAFHGFSAALQGTDDDLLLANIANFQSGGTAVVGSRLPNGFGLYDMAGNAGEWVNDWYSTTYYSSGAATDPVGPSSGYLKVRRGGDWQWSSYPCRAGIRVGDEPSFFNDTCGFRAARSP